MTKENLKPIGYIATLLIGTFWWIGDGTGLIVHDPDVDSYLDQLRGNGFFSVQSIQLFLIVASIMFYPIVAWWCFWFAVLDPALFRSWACSKSAIWVWAAPVTFGLFTGFLVVLRVVSSIIIWSVYIFGMVALVVGITRALAAVAKGKLSQ